jgi:tetratricopeptide (TPR) repeat protein
MSESAFTRFWNTVKPPPADNRPGSLKVTEQKRRQRRLVTMTLGVLVLSGLGSAAYSYVASAPQRADREFQEGMKMMSPGKYPDAVTHFTRALSISSQLPDAYLERGNAHRILGEPDAALADYQAAADLNPTLPAAFNGIALISLERHDLRHALEGFNKSIALHPTVEAYYQRGQILDSQGDHQKAIEDFDRAIGERPEAPYMYLARAVAKANVGDEEGAHADRLIASQLTRQYRP